MTTKPPLPPFTLETATQKVRAAEDAWNKQVPENIAQAYSPESKWRNRSEFINGRKEIIAFLTKKWQTEKNYRLIKEIWSHSDDRIAVRFAYEWQSTDGKWFRAYGNENWEFDALGLMKTRHASINDVPILERDRLFKWPIGIRPIEHPGLSECGL